MSVTTASNTVISVRDVLRSQTQDVHERLHDHPMFVGSADGTMTHRDYRSLLSALYGFHRPLENAIRKVPRTWWFGLDPQPRLRAHRLAEDLAHLGFDWTCAELLPVAKLSPIDSAGRLLGCLYARESATLGERVMARGLDPLLGGGIEGRRFFSGTPDNARLWREVCDALETAGAAGHLDEMIVAARATLESLEEWMNRAHARV